MGLSFSLGGSQTYVGIRCFTLFSRGADDPNALALALLASAQVAWQRHSVDYHWYTFA